MVDTLENRKIMSLEDIFFAPENNTPNYIPRPNIDDTFFRNMRNGKTIIVYGGPRSGKTTLIRKLFQESNAVWFYCSDSMTLADMNKQILKRGGYRAPDETSVETNHNATVTGSVKTTLPVAELEYAAEHASGETLTNTYKSDLNLEDPNDIADALKKAGFDDYIVVENYHKLDGKVQKQFESELKALIEGGVRFVICGEGYAPFGFTSTDWKQSGKLTYINVSMWDIYSVGRSTAFRADMPDVRVNVSAWDDRSLKSYIKICEEFLNIKYSDDFKVSLLENCLGVLSVVRAVCCEMCRRAGIQETQETLKTDVGAGADVKSMIREIFEQSNDPYRQFIETFAVGFEGTTKYKLYYWILHTVLTASTQELTEGIPLDTVKDRIKSRISPKFNRDCEITKALQNIEKLQKNRCSPYMVLKYDTYTKTLYILDKDFLVWLHVQEKKDLIEILNMSQK